MVAKNQTWELVDKLNHKFVIRVKWIFKTKLNLDGPINNLKVRLVVKGYTQSFGLDFRDTFAPVARMESIALSLALFAQKG